MFCLNLLMHNWCKDLVCFNQFCSEFCNHVWFAQCVLSNVNMYDSKLGISIFILTLSRMFDFCSLLTYFSWVKAKQFTATLVDQRTCEASKRVFENGWHPHNSIHLLCVQSVVYFFTCTTHLQQVLIGLDKISLEKAAEHFWYLLTLRSPGKTCINTASLLSRLSLHVDWRHSLLMDFTCLSAQTCLPY